MIPRLLALSLVVVLATCASTASAGGTQVVRLAPVQDVSLPFWCDWGYDWDERCYRDDGTRLPVGGEDDKVWRAALRFSIASVPPGSAVAHATLHLFHDGRCLGPRKTMTPCSAREYVLTAHPILSSDWFDERELDFGLSYSEDEIPDAARAQWLSFDVTGLVAGWVDGSRQNAGILLKLSEDHEDFGTSGPSLPSTTFAQPALQPQLEIGYLRASG